MNTDATENPYATPQIDLGETPVANAQASPRRSPPTWLWLFLVPLNACAGLLLAMNYMLTPWHVVGVLLGILVVGATYALLEHAFRSRHKDFLADMLLYGAVVRIPFQLLPVPEFMAATIGEGLIGLFTVQEKLPFFNESVPVPTPWSNFLLTTIVGTQLALMAFLLGMIPAHLKRRAR